MGNGWQGKNLDVVVGEELCGIACCMGSGIAALKDSALQRLMPERKQQKICVYIFEQYRESGNILLYYTLESNGDVMIGNRNAHL